MEYYYMMNIDGSISEYYTEEFFYFYNILVNRNFFFFKNIVSSYQYPFN